MAACVMAGRIYRLPICCRLLGGIMPILSHVPLLDRGRVKPVASRRLADRQPTESKGVVPTSSRSQPPSTHLSPPTQPEIKFLLLPAVHCTLPSSAVPTTRPPRPSDPQVAPPAAPSRARRRYLSIRRSTRLRASPAAPSPSLPPPPPPLPPPPPPPPPLHHNHFPDPHAPHSAPWAAPYPK